MSREESPAGGIRTAAGSAGTFSPANVFYILWRALADILGTAAAATLLRRAAQRTVPTRRSSPPSPLKLLQYMQHGEELVARIREPDEGARRGEPGIHFLLEETPDLIQLKYLELQGRLERGISLLKARGVRHATDVRRLGVERDGIQVGAPFEGLRGVLTGLPVPVKER